MKRLLFLLLLLPMIAVCDSEKLANRARFFTSVGVGTQVPDGALDVVGSGFFLPAASSEPADADISVSQWTLWLDEANDEFELKARESGGTIISVTVGSGGGGATFESRTITHIAADSTLTDRAGELEFNLSNITEVGDTGLITVADDSGNTRTTFTADVALLLDVTFASGLDNSTTDLEIFVNGSLVMKGSDRAQSRGIVTAHLRLAATDFVTINVVGGGIPNDAELASLSMRAFRVF